MYPYIPCIFEIRTIRSSHGQLGASEIQPGLMPARWAGPPGTTCRAPLVLLKKNQWDDQEDS